MTGVQTCALPIFSMTIKMANLGQGAGGSTTVNVTTSSLEVKINSYFNNATDLSRAATIIHEAFHCQLLSWFREAIVNNDASRKQQLASDYGYLFSTEIISMDSSLAYIVNGGDPTQHQDMINRYKSIIAEAIYIFAKAKSIPNVTLDYCQDLAWAGTFDSKAFANLSTTNQDRIIERVNAERDPYGNNVNVNSVTPKGNICP